MAVGVTEITSVAQLDTLIKDLPATQKLIVLDFHATWCGPCKFIAPQIERMAAAYSDVTFAKIDVDQVKELAQRYGVRSMPTFKFIKNGEVVDTVSGASPKVLLNAVAKHSGRNADQPKPGEEVALDSPGALSALPNLIKLLMWAYVAYNAYNWYMAK
jgi:thioredoxin 1